MTPEQEEEVRRALTAAARAEDAAGDRSMPPEVATRLDDVLAELVGDRTARATRVPAAPAGADTVVDEVGARRARRWPTVLVAAAAVAVIAATGGVVATRGLGGGGAGSSATSDSAASAGGQAPEADKAVPSPGGSQALAALPEPRLRTASLAADVQRAADATSTSGQAPRGAYDAQRREPGHASCRRPDVPRGADVVDVRLDGKPATLVLDPPSGGRREARVYSCADVSAPVATTTVVQR